MATQNEINTFINSIQDLISIKGKDFVSREEWGSINFKSVENDIEEIFYILDLLVELPIEHFPSSTLINVTGDFQRITRLLSEIDSFEIDKVVDPKTERDRICADLHHEAESLLSKIQPYIPYLISRREQDSKHIKTIRATSDEATQRLRRIKEWAEQQQETVERIVQTTQQSAVSTGIQEFTPEFDDEADRLETLSENWLIATGVLAVATICAAIYFYLTPSVSKDITEWDILLKGISKVTIIAVIFTATIWCGRIYRALAHQVTVNRHRALSLKTFQTFVEGTKDRQTRDAVLLAATNAVFANVPTGLVEPSGDQDNKLNIVELSKQIRSHPQ